MIMLKASVPISDPVVQNLNVFTHDKSHVLPNPHPAAFPRHDSEPLTGSQRA